MNPFQKISGKLIKQATIFSDRIEFYDEKNIQILVFASDCFGPISSFFKSHPNEFSNAFIQEVVLKDDVYEFTLQKKNKNKTHEFILEADGFKEIIGINSSEDGQKIMLEIYDFNGETYHITYKSVDGKWTLSQDDSYWVDDKNYYYLSEEEQNEYDSDPSYRFNDLISMYPKIEYINLLEHPKTRARILTGQCMRLY